MHSIFLLFILFFTSFLHAQNEGLKSEGHFRKTLKIDGAGSLVSRVAHIYLNAQDPSKSYGTLTEDGSEVLRFNVGFGKKGMLPAGEKFKGNYSLLGTFAVNAILTNGERFEMNSSLVKESGKSEDFLKKQLFKNMSSIDFDGDGKSNEYGKAFIGLEPLDSKQKQPFHFGEYKGVFRWYSYAIHGTQEESRVGQMITGGCVNVGELHITELAKRLKLGDKVEIHEVR